MIWCAGTSSPQSHPQKQKYTNAGGFFSASRKILCGEIEQLIVIRVFCYRPTGKNLPPSLYDSIDRIISCHFQPKQYTGNAGASTDYCAYGRLGRTAGVTRSDVGNHAGGNTAVREVVFFFSSFSIFSLTFPARRRYHRPEVKYLVLHPRNFSLPPPQPSPALHIQDILKYTKG